MFRNKKIKALTLFSAVLVLCFTVMPSFSAFCYDEFYNEDYYGDYYDDYYGDYYGDSYGDTEEEPGKKMYSKHNEVFRNDVYISDEAMLLSRQEIEKLLEDMYPVTEYSDAFVISISDNRFGHSDRSDEPEMYYCEYIYDSLYGRSSRENCVIFLIDMDNRCLTVFREGSADFKSSLTEGKCTSITDNVYSEASDGNYYECASKAMKQVYSVLSGQMILEPMKIMCNLLIGLSISFLVTYLIASAKSKIQKPDNDESLKYAVSKFEHSAISDVLTNTTRTYCPRSSGSGGSRGGGGGGHHGGGGSHRF